VTALASAGCKLSNCFQQGYNHPTPARFLDGVAVIAAVMMAFRRLRGKK